MRAGELRHAITIQQRATGTDANGQQVPSWTVFAETRAKVEQLSGYELMVSNAQRASNTVRFTIRYRAGVTERMRVIYDGQIHDITSVSDIEGRRKELEVMAKTGMNNG